MPKIWLTCIPDSSAENTLSPKKWDIVRNKYMQKPIGGKIEGIYCSLIFLTVLKKINNKERKIKVAIFSIIFGSAGNEETVGELTKYTVFDLSIEFILYISNCELS
tara:strand:+ start:487 stop:804 length:318 start_codon:yes stop_codon:yes gene_type:complete